MKQRLIVTLVVAATLLAGLAAAQDTTRSSTSPLGSITMTRDVSPAQTPVTVTANLSLSVAAARDAGAEYVSVSAGGDNLPAGVTVANLALSGVSAQPANERGDGTNRAYVTFNTADLPDNLTTQATFDVAYGEGTPSFDVEVVAVAMGSNFSTAKNAAGESFSLQSWTGIHPEGAPTTGTGSTDATNGTSDGNASDPATPTEPTTGAGDLEENEGEAAFQKDETPAAGVVAALAAVGAAAVTLRRRAR